MWKICRIRKGLVWIRSPGFYRTDASLGSLLRARANGARGSLHLSTLGEPALLIERRPGLIPVLQLGMAEHIFPVPHLHTDKLDWAWLATRCSTTPLINHVNRLVPSKYSRNARPEGITDAGLLESYYSESGYSLVLNCQRQQNHLLLFSSL